jgi:hypothetical protein
MAGHDLSLDSQNAFVEALEQFARMNDEQFQLWSSGAVRLARSLCEDVSARAQNRNILHEAMQ